MAIQRTFTHRIELRLPQSHVVLLDQLSRTIGINRPSVIRYAIAHLADEEAKTLSALGISAKSCW